ncbi:hypothetical protein M1403_03310 [Patescibacteria group bacterium]|nr:hypothetical protein [Patescibacteria group bacterium]
MSMEQWHLPRETLSRPKRLTEVSPVAIVSGLVAVGIALAMPEGNTKNLLFWGGSVLITGGLLVGGYQFLTR